MWSIIWLLYEFFYYYDYSWCQSVSCYFIPTGSFNSPETGILHWSNKVHFIQNSVSATQCQNYILPLLSPSFWNFVATQHFENINILCVLPPLEWCHEMLEIRKIVGAEWLKWQRRNEPTWMFQRKLDYSSRLQYYCSSRKPKGKARMMKADC